MSAWSRPLSSLRPRGRADSDVSECSDFQNHAPSPSPGSGPWQSHYPPSTPFCRNTAAAASGTAGVEDGRLWIALGLERRAPGQHGARRPLAATPRGLPLLGSRPSGKHPEMTAKQAWAAEDPYSYSGLCSDRCGLFIFDICSRTVYALITRTRGL